MADKTVQANCGFFDAVNHDRLYSADDMNRPYRNLFRNGIFLSPNGQVNDNFRPSYNGMIATVNAGEGLFGNKWFYLDDACSFNIPVNNSGNSRIDSIIIQVDNRTSERVGNIVYRPGTSSATPVAPSINTDPDVIEYRIANVNVAPQAVSVSVTDLRGVETDWVKVVVYDTGWQDITLTNGSAYNASRPPQIRRIGDVVYIRGSIKGLTGVSSFATLPEEYRPSQAHIYTSVQVMNASVLINTLVMNINSSGTFSILASSGSMSGGSAYEIVLNTSYAV